MGNRIALNIRLPEETIKALKLRAKRLSISQTQFVESLLNDALGLSEESFDPSPPLPMEDRIDAIEKAIATLEQKFNDFSEKSPSRLPHNEQSEPIRTNHPRSTTKGDTEPENVDLSSGLSQTDLGKRFNLYPSSINRQRKKGGASFAEWSKKNDPEGIAWRWEGTDKNLWFYPVE